MQATATGFTSVRRRANAITNSTRMRYSGRSSIRSRSKIARQSSRTGRRMHLIHLSLTNFRNYTRLELSLPEGPVLLYGANAQGKTSVLEAVYYLATARSPWTTSDRQLLNWRAQDDVLPFVKISAELCNLRRSTTRIDITLFKDSALENNH